MYRSISNSIYIFEGISSSLNKYNDYVNNHLNFNKEYISGLPENLQYHVNNLKYNIIDNIKMCDVTLSSGLKSNWYFDFLEIYPLAMSALDVMLPTYSPVGILSGGGLLVSQSIDCGFVDVKKEIFYPPKLGGKNITLIDDVLSTGKSFKKAMDIIRDYEGGSYVVKEQKVLLYRTDILTEYNTGNNIEPLFISVQSDNKKEKPKLFYVGRSE